MANLVHGYEVGHFYIFPIYFSTPDQDVFVEYIGFLVAFGTFPNSRLCDLLYQMCTKPDLYNDTDYLQFWNEAMHGILEPCKKTHFMYGPVHR